MRNRTPLVAFALVGLLAATVGAQTTTSVWTGGHTDGQWHNAANWDANGIPDANTDIAVFSDAGARLLVDLMTQTAGVHQVRFENALPANDYSISNGTIQLLGYGGARGRIEQMGTVAGVNTISANLQAAPGGADIIVRGSTLKLVGNNANLDAGTVATVYDGGVLHVKDANGLGGATVGLAGGTLQIVTELPTGPTEDGLIGRWDFEEGSGATTADLSTYGNDGTFGGSATFSSDSRIGSYSARVGISDSDRVNVGNNLPLIGQGNDGQEIDELTISLWIKAASNADTYRRIMGNNGYGSSSGGGSGFNLTPSGVSDNDITQLQLRAADTVASSETLETGSGWAHLLVTLDHGTVQYYYDGVAVGMSDAAGRILGLNADFALGNTTGENKGWRGWLDDVRFYDRVLTGEEIDSLYTWDGAGGGASGPVNATNPVHVTADSTIRYVNSDVGFGPLGLTGGAVLTAEPNDAELLSFTSITLNGNGGIRTLGDVTGGPVTNAAGGAATLNKLGPASLTIAPVAASALNDTTFLVTDGTLVAGAADGNTSLGNAAVRLAGGTLQLNPAAGAGGQDVRIDINDAAGSPSGNWNSVADINSTNPLIDFETGAASGVTLIFESDPHWHTSSSQGDCWLSANPLPDWAQLVATRDYFFTEGGDANMVFTGLAPKALYQVELIGCHYTDTFSSEGEYDILEDGEPATIHNPYVDGHQDGKWITWDNVSPDASGTLTLNVAAGSGPGSRPLSFINAIRLYYAGDPTTYYGTDIGVDADSAIQAAGIIELGTLTLHNGSMLTVAGDGPTDVLFETTALDPNGAAVTGLNVGPDTTVYAGEYSPAGAAITFQKLGAGTLVFNDANALLNDANSVLAARGGVLGIARTAADTPVPGSALLIDGGTLALASAAGEDVTVDNALTIGPAGGTLAARIVGNAAGGATVTVIGDPDIPAGATLTFSTADAYTLAIEGDVIGAGSAAMLGTIDANGSIDLGGTLALNGTVGIAGDVTTAGNSVTVGGGVATVAGTTTTTDLRVDAGQYIAKGPIVASGAVDANGGTITANDTIDAGQILVRGGLLEAYAPAVSEDQVVVSGGQLDIHSTLDSNSGDPELRIVGSGVVRAIGVSALRHLSNVIVDKNGGGGQLYLDSAQSKLPDLIHVRSGALLAGAMGTADFNPGGNVFFEDEAVFGWSGGNKPTTVQLDAMAPGTRLLGAIIGGRRDESFVVGDDGNALTTEDIFKGVSFGSWTEADFLGTIADGGTGGLIIAMNDTNAGIDDANLLSPAGMARFTGGGTLTWKGLDVAESDVTRIERIGPAGGEAATAFDVDPGRVLEGSLAFHLENTTFDVDNAAQIGNSTVTIADGALLRLDNDTPTTGTVVVTGSGVVVSENQTRLRGGTDFQFETAGQGGGIVITSEYLDYTTDPLDTGKLYVDPNANLILSRTSGWVRIGSSTPVVTDDWVLGDGRAIVVAREWGADGISDNRDGTLLGRIRAVDGAEKIIIGVPTGKGMQVEPAVRLGETNLQIGDSKLWSLPWSADDNTREMVALGGTIRFRGPVDANDVIVESGSLTFDNDRQGGSVIVNNILGSEGTGALRFEDINAFNIGVRSIAGGITWRGTEVFIDEDSAFQNALNTTDPGAAFAEEIVLGGAARLNLDVTAGGDAKPWDPASNTRLIMTPIRIEADDPGMSWNHNLRTRRASGSSNVHTTFMDVTLEDGAVLSVDEDNTTVVVNIKLDGDATTTRRAGLTGGADDFEIYNVVSTGGDRVWTVGDPDDTVLLHYLAGQVGDAAGDLTLNMKSGKIIFLDSSEIAPNTVINMSHESLIRPQVPQADDGFGHPVLKVFGQEINVLDDGNSASLDARIAAQRSGDPTGEQRWGVVQFTNVHLGDGSTTRIEQANNAAPVVDFHIEGNVALSNTSTNRWHLGDVTADAPATMTVAGNQSLRLIGSLDPEVTLDWQAPQVIIISTQDNSVLDLNGLDLGYGDSFKLNGGTINVNGDPTSASRMELWADPSDASGGVINVLGRVDQSPAGWGDQALLIDYGREGLTWGDPNATVRLHHERGVRIATQDYDAGAGEPMVVNEINMTFEVVEGAMAWVRSDERGHGAANPGHVHLNHVRLNEGSTLEMYNDDGARLQLSGEVVGNATIHNGDNDNEMFLGDWTGAGTLTVGGAFHTRVTGTMAPAGVTVGFTDPAKLLVFGGSAALEAGVVTVPDGVGGLKFNDESTIDVGTMNFNGGQVIFRDGMAVGIGTANFNADTDLTNLGSLSIDAGNVDANVQIAGTVTGGEAWRVIGGTLTATGADAIGSSFELAGGRVEARVDGSATPASSVLVTEPSELNVGPETADSDQTVTFGPLGMSFDTSDTPTLNIASGNGYDVTFTGTTVNATAESKTAEINVTTGGTIVDLGDVTLNDNNLALGAATGSVVRLGALTGGSEARLQFGWGTAQGGGLALSNVNPGDWLGSIDVDNATLVVDRDLQGYDRDDPEDPAIFVGWTLGNGILDVTYDGATSLREFVALNLRLSNTMADVVGPMSAAYDFGEYGLYGGSLILNHEYIDANFRMTDTDGNPAIARLAENLDWDLNQEPFTHHTAIRSEHDGADFQAPLELDGIVRFGKDVADLGGDPGEDFTVSGVISDENSFDPGTVLKVGDETVTLTGENTYDGDTIIEGGTMVMGHLQAFGDNFNYVSVTNGMLALAVPGADFSIATGYELVLKENSCLCLDANGIDLTDVLIGDNTLRINVDSNTSTAPADPVTGRTVINAASVHEDFTVTLGATIELGAGVSSTVHSVIDNDDVTFLVDSGQTLTIADDVLLDDNRTWAVGNMSSTVAFAGSIDSDGWTVTKAGYGSLVLSGATNKDTLAELVIGDGTPGGVVTATSADAAPTSVVVNGGGLYTVQAADYAYAEVAGPLAPADSGIVALSADSSADIDFSGNTVFFGAMVDANYSGTLTPSVSGYFFGGGGATLTIQSALNGGATGATFGWDDTHPNADANNNPAFGEGTVVLAAENTLSGPVDIHMPVVFGAKALESVPAIRVYEGGSLDLNDSGAREDNIQLLGGSIADTGGTIEANSLIWQSFTGDYIVGSFGTGTTSIEDGAFTRLDANLWKVGTDTVSLLGPAGASSLNTYAWDLNNDGNQADRGATTVLGGTLSVPDPTALGGTMDLRIDNGSTMAFRAGGSLDAAVSLNGTLQLAPGATLSLTDANASFALGGDSTVSGDGATLDLGDNTVAGTGELTVASNTVLRTAWTAAMIDDALILREGSTVIYTSNDDSHRRIGEMYPGATIQFDVDVSNGFDAERAIRFVMDPATYGGEGANPSEASPYRLGGAGRFGSRTNSVDGTLLSPALADGNTPTAYIEKFGTNEFVIGRFAYRPEQTDRARKFYWLVKEGALRSHDDAYSSSSTLGATAHTWIFPDPDEVEDGEALHPGIGRAHLEGIKVFSGAELQWRGTQGFLPESLWTSVGYAAADGDGFNRGEFVLQDGATLIGSPNYGLTLGFQADPGLGLPTTYLCYPTVEATGPGVPTITLGGDLNLRSGIDATSANPAGKVNVVVRSGEVKFTGDLPGAEGMTDVIEQLEVQGGSAVIYRSHDTTMQQTAIAMGGTLRFDANSDITYGAAGHTIQSDGFIHAASGTTDLGTATVVGTPPAAAAWFGGLVGGRLTGNVSTAENPGTFGVVSGPEGALDIYSSNGGTGAGNPWQYPPGPDNTTLVYTGEVWLDGNATFGENIDDKVRLWITDPNTGVRTSVLSDDSWNNVTIGTYEPESGADWYEFELRMSNGNGGYGWTQSAIAGWDTSGFGFGMDPNGTGDPNAPNFIYPMDDGSQTRFRVYYEPVATGQITVDPNATMRLGGFTEMGTVTAHGTLELRTGTSTADRLVVPEGGTLNIGPAATNIAVGEMNGTLLGSGGTAGFDTLTVGGATPVIDLGPTGLVSARNATFDSPFTFGANSKTSVSETLTVGGGVAVTVAPGASVNAGTIAVDGTLSLTGGDAAFTSMDVAESGTVEFDHGTGTKVYTGDIHTRGLVRARSGETDLSESVIQGTLVTADVVRDNGLLSYYGFEDPAESATVADGSGNGHDAVVNGMVGWVPGQVGQAVSFNGSESNFIEDADASAYLNGLDSLTMAMWVKSTSTDSDRGWITANGGRTGNPSDGWLTMRHDASVSGTSNPTRTNAIIFANSTSGTKTATTSSNVTTTDWQFVAITWRSGELEQLYYSDGGVLVAEPDDYWPGAPGGTLSGLGALRVGQTSTFPGDTRNAWDGLVDEVHIFDRALSQLELQALFGGGGGAVVGDIRVDPNASLAVKGFANISLVDVATNAELTIGSAASDCADLQIAGTGLVDVGFSLRIHGAELADVLADIDAGSLGSSTLAGHEDEWKLVTVADGDGVLLQVTVYGDSNLDGQVDERDFQVLEADFGQAGDWLAGDFTGDEVVDHLDYLVWKDFAGQSYDGPGGTIPEPMTLVLLGVGAAAVLQRRRRRRA